LKLNNLKRIAVGFALGGFVLLAGTTAANAQDRDDRRDSRREQKIARKQAKIEQQRARLQQQRRAEWSRRNNQLTVTRMSNGTAYYTIDPNTNITSGRYRVYRDGRAYNTDYRGADTLRQAVAEGYRQGFNAGRSDMGNSRRNGGWSNSSMYRSGVYGYQNSVERSQYQYYFRQGFQRGYQDGSNSEYREGYTGSYQYGNYDNGSPSILATVLNQILNLQSY
jgi:hypothetical protein